MKFLTLSNERSGSSFFQRLLDSHDQIRARQEDLRVSYHKNNAFMYDLYYKSRITTKCFGIKVLYNQMYEGLIDFCKKHDIKIIQVIRKDLLECAVWYRARGKSNLRNYHDIGTLGTYYEFDGKVEVKVQQTIDYIKNLHKNIQDNRKYADYVVYYEDFTGKKDTQHFYNKDKREELLNWLGVQDTELSVSADVNKKNKRPITEECVSNYRELIRKLKGQKVKYYYE